MLYNITLTPTSHKRCYCRKLNFHSHLQFFHNSLPWNQGIRVTLAHLQSCGKGKNLAGYLESYQVPVHESSNKFKSANMSCMQINHKIPLSIKYPVTKYRRGKAVFADTRYRQVPRTLNCKVAHQCSICAPTITRLQDLSRIQPCTRITRIRIQFQWNQWKQHASAARDLAKSGQGYQDPVERQVRQQRVVGV